MLSFFLSVVLSGFLSFFLRYVQGLGATRPIDYHSANWWDPAVLQDASVDVVYV